MSKQLALRLVDTEFVLEREKKKAATALKEKARKREWGREYYRTAAGKEAQARYKARLRVESEEQKSARKARERAGNNASKKTHRWQQPSYAKQRELRTGVSAELFATLMQLQQGKCAVCACTLEGKRACADHCHDTGRPRGILCPRCNVTEGAIKNMGLTPRGFAERLQQYLDNPPARIAELL